MQSTAGEVKTNSYVMFLWTSSLGRPNVKRPNRTYLQHPREDTGCCQENLVKVMDDRDEW